MKVGVLKDIKVGEYRVIATPAEVSMLVGDGNEVYVQKGAGEGSGFPDEAYVKEGAKLVDKGRNLCNLRFRREGKRV